MNHFTKNLLLLPFRLIWDVLLILAVIILQIVWLGLLCSFLGLWLVFSLFSFEALSCVICPIFLLSYLKNPWPDILLIEHYCEVRKLIEH